MSDTAHNIPEALERLVQQDPTLDEIRLSCARYTNKDLVELVDCLILYPNVVTHVYLNINWMTDETGIKLAQYIARSTTIQWLSLYDNRFGDATYLAMAAALRVNTSLRVLNLQGNLPIDKNRIELEFINALILNPKRPIRSAWFLYSFSNDFERLKAKAEQLGHPNMQSTLALI